MRTCVVRGCGRKAHGFGRLCNSHWKRFVRHGEATQIGIRAADLKPFKRHIRAWIAKRKNADAIWTGMRKAWQQCLDTAEAAMREIEAQQRCISWERRTWLDIMHVGNDADRDEIILTIAAMGYLSACEPRTFLSDRAFRFQTARRFRALSDVNVAEHYNHGTGKVHRVYRDPSRMHAEFLGKTLAEALAAYGLEIYSQEQMGRLEAEEVRTATFAAISDARTNSSPTSSTPPPRSP